MLYCYLKFEVGISAHFIVLCRQTFEKRSDIYQLNLYDAKLCLLHNIFLLPAFDLEIVYLYFSSKLKVLQVLSQEVMKLYKFKI